MTYYDSILEMIGYYIGFFLFMDLFLLIGYLLARKGKKAGAWVLYGIGAGLQLFSMVGISKTGSLASIAWLIYVALLALFAFLIFRALAAAPARSARQPAGQYVTPQYPGNVPVNRVPGSSNGMPAAPGWASPAAQSPQPVPQNNPFQTNGAVQPGAFGPAQPVASAPVNPAPAADAGTARFCKSCGARLPEGSVFCPNCGAMTG